ncbi:DUF4227 family protein [Brevibacillus sp. B_LB10_24]|uniref:DUF4227 family protein n=1 Tax=Brevibacillus sp. B_LB10_24 TaxID=3380645 RepID=UPI0038BCFD12
MGVTLRRLMELVRFFLVFITCSLVCYAVVMFLSDRFLPGNPYREPHGNAVKVVKAVQNEPSADFEWYLRRMQLFYLVGE